MNNNPAPMKAELTPAEAIVDYSNELRITNLGALPRGTGCPYLLVTAGLRDGEYVAKRWMRKLPRTVAGIDRIVRF